MAKTITEPRRKIKMDWKDRLFHTINYTAFILFALICFYPFYYLFISTISRNDFVDLGKITFYPIGIHFQNYIHHLPWLSAEVRGRRSSDGEGG